MHADGLGLHGRELLLERLMVAREPLERLHLVGGEPGLVVVARRSVSAMRAESIRSFFTPQRPLSLRMARTCMGLTTHTL